MTDFENKTFSELPYTLDRDLLVRGLSKMGRYLYELSDYSKDTPYLCKILTNLIAEAPHNSEELKALAQLEEFMEAFLDGYMSLDGALFQSAAGRQLIQDAKLAQITPQGNINFALALRRLWVQRMLDEVRTWVSVLDLPQYMRDTITTPDQADAFIRALHADGLLYHFDDDPRSVINVESRCKQVFNPTQCRLLTARVREMRRLDGYDMFELAVELGQTDPEADPKPAAQEGYLKEVTKDGKCSNCGCRRLTLAEDAADYTDVVLLDGEWERIGGSNRVDGGERRLYCGDCGTYFHMPKELE